MNRRTRGVIALSLLFVTAAVIKATPLFMEDEVTNTTSEFSFDMSYERVSSTQDLVHVKDYSSVQQGSFFLHSDAASGYFLSPLIDTDVEITITGLIARATVTQAFSNPTQEWLNGIYAFPLPENAAVDKLTMTIGERTIVGEIKPKQKAQKLYQQAKREGKKASLLVQNRPNLFTNSVANIGPGEKVKVTIEYQQAVTFDQGIFSLRFPTTITERYLPAKRTIAPNATIGQSGWGITQPVFNDNAQQDIESTPPLHKVALNIALNAGFPLASIESELHPITYQELENNLYHINLKQDMIANQDFVLNWQAKPNQQPSAAHFIQQKGEDQYGMIMLLPPSNASDTASLPREVIFVIDTSGSMSGTSMEQAKQSLIYAINQLAETDTFNIVQFNSYAKKMANSPLIATPESKQKAIHYVNRLRADGGTEMLAALQLALGKQMPEAQRLRQVIFITDGSVGNETELFGYIDTTLGRSRLFTVGIGSAPNSYFMTEAAQMGKGTYTYVNSVSAVQQKMEALFTKLTQPMLADLQIDMGQDIEMYPSNLPDLYQGEPLMISYRSTSPTVQMNVSGALRNQYWQQSLDLQQSGQQSGVATLWARRKIAQLERDKYQGQDASAINQQILNLALEHHIVSSMTSLIAIDKTPTAPVASKDSRVKNLRPKGQTTGVLPKTATASTLYLIVATLLLMLSLSSVFLTRRN